MDPHKHSLPDSSLLKSPPLNMSKPINAKQFLNRFNELPTYNAIHAKNHKDTPHQTLHCKTTTKNKVPLFKLKLEIHKNIKPRTNLSSSTRQKSDSKRQTFNTLMSTQQPIRIAEKYHFPTNKINFFQQQAMPSVNEILKNIKIKSNIQRLSLKLNYNYYPGTDQDLSNKKHQRFSYAPMSSNLEDHYSRPDSQNMKSKKTPSIVQKKSRDSNPSKMTKSFIRIKCPPVEDFDQKNLRGSKIASNFSGSLKNSRINQVQIDPLQTRLKTQNRLNLNKKLNNSKLDPSKFQQPGSQSMKALYAQYANETNNSVPQRQRINKKSAVKSYNKFKIIKTQLKDEEKQNYEPKTSPNTKNPYIMNLVKTSNLSGLVNASVILQNQHVTNVSTKYISPINPISLIHPEGEFPQHFQTQFNPW